MFEFSAYSLESINYYDMIKSTLYTVWKHIPRNSEIKDTSHFENIVLIKDVLTGELEGRDE